VLPDGLVLVMYFGRRCFPLLDPALGVPLRYDPPVSRLDPRTKKQKTRRYLFGGSTDPETFTYDPSSAKPRNDFSADQLSGLQILDIPSAGAIADLFAQFPTLPVSFFRFPVRALLRAPHDDWGKVWGAAVLPGGKHFVMTRKRANGDPCLHVCPVPSAPMPTGDAHMAAAARGRDGAPSSPRAPPPTHDVGPQ
jgi:hypothetical protein